MRLAWFRAAQPDVAAPAGPLGGTRPALDDTAALIAELRSTHDIVVLTAATAHDFVWTHVRAPYDVWVYELNNTPAHQFVWPYVMHYGGVLLLRTLTLHDSRAQALAREQRTADYIAEFTFNHGRAPRTPTTACRASRGRWPMLRAPLLASRLVVVPHAAVAAALQDTYPEARVRVAPTAVQAVQYGPQAHSRSVVTFGVLTGDRLDVVQRAMQRACNGGAAATLMIRSPVEHVLRDADVMLALRWPVFGEPETPALAGMAAGKPVVVFETEATADWPSLDPQTWQRRGFIGDSPVAVSIDPRDEEHSLVLAIRRLSADAGLRAQLGAAAHDWWRTHATSTHAADAWRRILAEAASLDPPAHPPDWPAHLTADGTERARAIFIEFGVGVDLF